MHWNGTPGCWRNMAELLAAGCGGIIGIALGLTGGGGSLFAVPLLVLVIGLPPGQAVPVSLLVVAFTASIGAAEAISRRLIAWRPTLIVAVAGVLTAPLGLWIGSHLEASVRLGAFLVLASALALRMGWTAHDGAPAQAVRALPGADPAAPACRYNAASDIRITPRCAVALSAAGGITGTLSGLFGVGGGFLIVPALQWVTQMGMHQAVATSLVIIAMVGGSGALAAGTELQQAGTAVLYFCTGSAAGMLAGRALAHHLAGPALQRFFAVSLGITVLITSLRMMEGL